MLPGTADGDASALVLVTVLAVTAVGLAFLRGVEDAVVAAVATCLAVGFLFLAVYAWPVETPCDDTLAAMCAPTPWWRASRLSSPRTSATPRASSRARRRHSESDENGENRAQKLTSEPT
ncbi:MAG: hypothetical protein ABEJ68_06060 [Halobacteriaceae archaeon]